MVEFIDDKNVEYNSLNSIIYGDTTIHLDEVNLRKLVNDMWVRRPDLFDYLPCIQTLTDRVEKLSIYIEDLESDYYDLKDKVDEYESLLDENDIDY